MSVEVERGQAVDEGNPGLLVRVGDGLVALLFFGSILVEIWFVADLPWARWQQVLATAVAPVIAGPLIFRTVRPFAAYVVNAVGMYVMVALHYSSDVYQWSNLILLFAVSVTYRGRESTIAILAGLGGVVFYFGAFRDEDATVGAMVLALWFVVWLLGRIQGAREVERQLRSDRDVAAELAAARQARLQLEEQRTTMARELHDLIGHTVNVMVVHAGAGRRAVESDPDGATRAFETIETTGRSALDELDRVLGLLRNNDPATPLAPLPGIATLPTLIEEMRATGLEVDYSSDGPVEAMPNGVGLTVYRVVQEALTNTMKHSSAARAGVTVVVANGAANVEVTDDGHGEATETTTGGRGLAGIRERVQLHGGTVAAGPVPGSGFRVMCSIPMSNGESRLNGEAER